MSEFKDKKIFLKAVEKLVNKKDMSQREIEVLINNNSLLETLFNLKIHNAHYFTEHEEYSTYVRLKGNYEIVSEEYRRNNICDLIVENLNKRKNRSTGGIYTNINPTFGINMGTLLVANKNAR